MFKTISKLMATGLLSLYALGNVHLANAQSPAQIASSGLDYCEILGECPPQMPGPPRPWQYDPCNDPRVWHNRLPEKCIQDSLADFSNTRTDVPGPLINVPTPPVVLASADETHYPFQDIIEGPPEPKEPECPPKVC